MYNLIIQLIVRGTTLHAPSDMVPGLSTKDVVTRDLTCVVRW